MPLYVKETRLREAIVRLSDWKGQVQSQAINHLFPFLGLISKGVGADAFKKYEEHDDLEFFDHYFDVKEKSEKPYFDPLNRKFRIKTHPHSNVATLRKNTFENRWNAASSERRSDGTYWKLADNADTILAERALTRAGVTRRANVIDLAVWLFRTHEFPDGATSDDILALFRNRFPMPDAMFDRLFEYVPEDTEHLFNNSPLSTGDVARVTSELVVDEEKIKRYLEPSASESEREMKSALEDDDPILSEVRALIALGSSGMILRGAPGTSKSWYAWNIALSLTNNQPDKICRVQFHPSYGYEDFVEGYLPNEESRSGFSVEKRIFLDVVKRATESQEIYVFVIDEINRGDTSRIFGELLTYIEDGWRDVPFLAKLSGEEVKIPKNLVLLATMNPHDRSVTQLDMALLRRFDHIDIAPSTERAAQFMLDSGMPVVDANMIAEWFGKLQALLPFGLGHAYFRNVGDIGRLGLVWRYRILPFCESILEFDPDRLANVKRSFESLDRRLRGQVEG